MTATVRPLLIFGAGGFGREVLAYARDLGLEVAGFVDDNTNALDGFDVGVAVLGGFDQIVSPTDYEWVIAIGDPAIRMKVHGILADAGVTLATIVHPTAYVATAARIGVGAVICPFAFVSPFVTVGPNVVLNTYASAGHDARIGAHAVLSPYAVVNGFVSLGTATFMGTHATVIPGKTVGAATRIGAGAVVTSDVGAGFLMVGMPATGRQKYPVPEE